jgi:hypothetical protein
MISESQLVLIVYERGSGGGFAESLVKSTYVKLAGNAHYAEMNPGSHSWPEVLLWEVG